jgi:AcrR family transcriptional regulator
MTAQAALRPPRQDNRRRQLLDAAARRFARQGFRATTIRDVAGDAGMLPGSLYYHFASKNDLLLAVYEEGVRRIAANVDRAVAEASGSWARLEAASTAHLETVLDRSDYAQVIVRVLPQDARDVSGRLVALRDQYERRFERLVDDLDLPPPADRRNLRLFLLGALNWAQVWYRAGGAAPADIARGFTGYLRRALDGGQKSR